MVKVLIEKNQAAVGGGIDSAGGLSVFRSKVTRNKAFSQNDRSYAGGIRVNSATSPVTVIRSSVTKNKSIAKNADAFAGGIYFSVVTSGENRELFIDRSTIADNLAKGAGYGFGGGIQFQPILSGGTTDLEIVRSTLSGNRAVGENGYSFGGAVFYQPVANGAGSNSPFILSNSTVTNNLAKLPSGSALGGALYLAPLANTGGTTPQTITNSTIAGNEASAVTASGGGIGVEDYGGSTPTVANSIIANNKAATGKNCSVPLTSLEGNLERGTTCDFDEPGDIPSANPKLKKLGHYGGPTRTMALPQNSPAVDAAPILACLPVDQRGINRPQGPLCDAGAFELKD